MTSTFEDPHLDHDYDACTWCGAEWVEVPEVGRGAKEMAHSEDCEYIVWVKSLPN